MIPNVGEVVKLAGRVPPEHVVAAEEKLIA
jgi:hypothetical protein